MVGITENDLKLQPIVVGVHQGRKLELDKRATDLRLTGEDPTTSAAPRGRYLTQRTNRGIAHARRDSVSILQFIPVEYG